jgi:DNA-binding PadR family transcriptional regulator
MIDRSRQRSPLALTVLALLAEETMHPYRMHELIRHRGKDTVVNVAQRNSVYQTIARLLRVGWIRARETRQDAGRPERVVYEITESGRATLARWMTEMLATPAREYPEFPAALAFLPILNTREAQRQLERRVRALEEQLSQAQAQMRSANKMGLPRLFLVEEEYKQAMLLAELNWTRKLVQALRSKQLRWSEKWLRAVAARFEPAPEN